MWSRTFLIILTCFCFAETFADAIRYRGDYTLGHEVNSFCPDNNSQCYWVSGKASSDTVVSLKDLYQENATLPYEKVCVVLAGSIDRELHRDGFAADYDGLFTPEKVFGLCGETDLVVAGDLQHHRWVLVELDGVVLHQPERYQPSIEIGEHLTFMGFSGCNNMRGNAQLQGNTIVIPRIATTRKACPAPFGQIESSLLSLLSQSPKISLSNESELLLSKGQFSSRWQLADWR